MYRLSGPGLKSFTCSLVTGIVKFHIHFDLRSHFKDNAYLTPVRKMIKVTPKILDLVKLKMSK